MHEREYKKLKREIQAEYDEKIKALEMVWRMSGGASQSASKNSGTAIGKGSLLQAVRYALPKISGEFTLREVIKQIQADNPVFAETLKRASLSSTLKRLANDKEIVLVMEGKGKRASKFRRSG